MDLPKVYFYGSSGAPCSKGKIKISVTPDSLWPYGLLPTSSSVHGISQARILEWVTISSSRGPSQPRNQAHVSCSYCVGKWILYLWATIWSDDISLTSHLIKTILWSAFVPLGVEVLDKFFDFTSSYHSLMHNSNKTEFSKDQSKSNNFFPHSQVKKRITKIRHFIVKIIEVHLQAFSGRMDCSLPGSSVHAVFQARIPEQVAISYSRWSSPPRNQT